MFKRLIATADATNLAIPQSARNALDVPDCVFGGWPETPPVGNVPRSRFFTEDPYVLRWQWRRVADAIVLVK
eukprot:SAG11_NODE_478_length_9117_cov_6.916168_1_plen_71_part_10